MPELWSGHVEGHLPGGRQPGIYGTAGMSGPGAGATPIREWSGWSAQGKSDQSRAAKTATRPEQVLVVSRKHAPAT